MSAFTDAKCALNPRKIEATTKKELKEKIRYQQRVKKYFQGLREFNGS